MNYWCIDMNPKLFLLTSLTGDILTSTGEMKRYLNSTTKQDMVQLSMMNGNW